MNHRTEKAVAETVAYLKQLKREGKLLVGLAAKERAHGKNDTVPNKSRTKLSRPLSAGTVSSYGENVFRECPGGARGQTTVGLLTSIMKMIEAEETGCRVVPDSTGMRNGKPYAPNTTQWGYRGGE